MIAVPLGPRGQSMRFFPWQNQLAVDVGTATIHVSVKGGGVVVREPNAVAFAGPRRRPIAYGSAAKQMLDREVSDVQVVRPMQGGVIADFDAAAVLLRHLIHEALGHRPLLAPTVVTAEPTRSTQVERRALVTALRAAGAGEVIVIPRALAAAVGAGMPMDHAHCRLIVDMGAGATDIGVLSGGMVAEGASLHFGGEDLDEAIVRYVKRRQQQRIGRATAEDIKVLAGATPGDPEHDQLRVEDPSGVANGSGLRLEGIPELMAATLRPVAGEVQWILECLPDRQVEEIAASEGVLTGGCALMRGAAELLSRELALTIRPATDPMSCTILGLEAILNDLESLTLDGRRFSR